MGSRTDGIPAGKLARGLFAACVLALAAAQTATAAQVVYVTSLISTFNLGCRLADFGCTAGRPVSPAGRSGFIDELEKKGLKVAAAAPAGGSYFKVSATLRDIQLAPRKDKDGYYTGTCEVTGLVQGGRIPPRLSELDLRHRFRLTEADFDSGDNLSRAGLDNVMSACLRRQAHWVAEIIRKYP